MSMNRTWAISSWISFLTSAGIPIRAEMCAAEDILNRAVGRRDQSCLESPASCHIASALAHSRTAVYSRSAFEIGNQRSKIGNCTVPVVQRKEQGFPNPDGSPLHAGKPLSQSCQQAPESAIRRQLSGDNCRCETIVSQVEELGGYYLLWLV